MEKATPHRKLAFVKTLIEAGKARSTHSALIGAAALGFDFAGIVSVIMALTPKDFYKSMTFTLITGFGRTCIGRSQTQAGCI